jgi:GxxExxY protein
MNSFNNSNIDALPELSDLSYAIIGCAYKVHRELGPGLLESSYQICLAHELSKTKLHYEAQKHLPIEYDGILLSAGYRVDFLIEDNIIVELKAVSEISRIHYAQTLSYMKLSGVRLGLLLNFNVTDMKKGIHRIVR